MLVEKRGKEINSRKAETVSVSHLNCRVAVSLQDLRVFHSPLQIGIGGLCRLWSAGAAGEIMANGRGNTAV